MNAGNGGIHRNSISRSAPKVRRCPGDVNGTPIAKWRIGVEFSSRNLLEVGSLGTQSVLKGFTLPLRKTREVILRYFFDESRRKRLTTLRSTELCLQEWQISNNMEILKSA